MKKIIVKSMTCGAAFLLLSSLSGMADLVASLHASADGNIVADQNTGSSATRTSNGDIDTRGLIGGTLRFQTSDHTTADLTGGDLSGFSANTTVGNINRFAGNALGLVTWDYDITSATTPFGYSLVVNYELHSTDHPGSFYISYNDGVSLTLDATDITGVALGSASTIVADTSKYTLLGTVAGASGSSEFNISAVVASAQANGGGIRIAYVESGFRGDIRFTGNSGINSVSAVPEPSSVALILLGGVLILGRRMKKLQA